MNITSSSEAPTDTQKILDSIRRIVRALRVSSRYAEKELGLSGAQLFVLQKLGERGLMSINELAERTLTHQSSVSVVVSRLVERGLVSRSPSAEDARKSDLALSAAGRAFLKKAPPTAQERLVASLDRMPLGERRRLASLLDWLGAESGFGAESASLFFEEEEKPSLAEAPKGRKK